MHSGALNKPILEQHDCLGKNCTFLEKNCQSPFWRVLEEAKLTKEKRKEKKASKGKRKPRRKVIRGFLRTAGMPIWRNCNTICRSFVSLRTRH